MPNTLTVIFSLIGVIAFILVMFWAARRFQKKFGHTFGYSGKNLRIEESAALSPDTRLIVAVIDGRRFLIGTGNAHLLAELSAESPDTQAEDENSPPASGRMPFTEAFKVVLSDKLGKGTKTADTHGDNKDVGKES